MLLMPNKDWHWEFNTRYQQLSISLGSEMEFLTPYKTKLLIPDALGMTEFSVEHAKYYIRLLEILPKVMEKGACTSQKSKNIFVATKKIDPKKLSGCSVVRLSGCPVVGGRW